MQQSLIYDNGASQKGKGTDFARERLKKHMRQFYRIASKEFEENKFRFYADGVHVPDSIRNQEGSRGKTDTDDKQTVTKDDIKRYQNALVYTQRLCDGIDPVSGKVTNTISLENPNIMRYLFYIKEFLEKHKME